MLARSSSFHKYSFARAPDGLQPMCSSVGPRSFNGASADLFFIDEGNVDGLLGRSTWRNSSSGFELAQFIANERAAPVWAVESSRWIAVFASDLGEALE